MRRILMTDKGLVLVAEDDDLLREGICEELEFNGYRTIRAKNGREGLALSLSELPLVILTDLIMPEISGLEMIFALREKGVEIPTVIFTAFGTRENAIGAIRLGVVDFVEKPIRMEYLLEVLERAVELGKDIRDFELELEKSSPPESASALGGCCSKRARLAKMILRRDLRGIPKRA